MASSAEPAPSHGPMGACVSLCYDGGDPSHVESVLPCLGRFGLVGTFYLDPPALLEDVVIWRAASNEGHEIGCHSLARAADQRGNLSQWTLEMVDEDLRMGLKLLSETFPRQHGFSFAFPGPEANCLKAPYDRTVVSYREVVSRLFEVARSATGGFNEPWSLNLGDLLSIDVADHTFEEMAAIVERGESASSWTILVFGGVGSGESAVDLRDHEALCRWLSQRSQTCPCRPVWRHAVSIRAFRESQRHTFRIESGPQS